MNINIVGGAGVSRVTASEFELGGHRECFACNFNNERLVVKRAILTV
jgi:hypothetical protein